MSKYVINASYILINVIFFVQETSMNSAVSSGHVFMFSFYKIIPKEAETVEFSCFEKSYKNRGSLEVYSFSSSSVKVLFKCFRFCSAGNDFNQTWDILSYTVINIPCKTESNQINPFSRAVYILRATKSIFAILTSVQQNPNSYSVILLRPVHLYEKEYFILTWRGHTFVLISVIDAATITINFKDNTNYVKRYKGDFPNPGTYNSTDLENCKLLYADPKPKMLLEINYPGLFNVNLSTYETLYIRPEENSAPLCDLSGSIISSTAPAHVIQGNSKLNLYQKVKIFSNSPAPSNSFGRRFVFKIAVTETIESYIKVVTKSGSNRVNYKIGTTTGTTIMDKKTDWFIAYFSGMGILMSLISDKKMQIIHYILKYRLSPSSSCSFELLPIESWQNDYQIVFPYKADYSPERIASIIVSKGKQGNIKLNGAQISQSKIAMFETTWGKEFAYKQLPLAEDDKNTRFHSETSVTFLIWVYGVFFCFTPPARKEIKILECLRHEYGTFCDNKCLNCKKGCTNTSASCIDSECVVGFFGAFCQSPCNCAKGASCDSFGDCPSKCLNGFWGTSCNLRCIKCKKCNQKNGECLIINKRKHHNETEINREWENLKLLLIFYIFSLFGVMLAVMATLYVMFRKLVTEGENDSLADTENTHATSVFDSSISSSTTSTTSNNKISEVKPSERGRKSSVFQTF